MKLFFPDPLYNKDLISASVYLYFSEDIIADTLHASVSTSLHGFDHFDFFDYVNMKNPLWLGNFQQIVQLWIDFRKSLNETKDIISIIKTENHKTIWLVYPKTEEAMQKSEDIITSSKLDWENMFNLIDPFVASDEVMAHILHEKYTEIYLSGEDKDEYVKSKIEEHKKITPGNVMGYRDVDWEPLYQHCNSLFSSQDLKTLLTKAYLLRLPYLSNLNEILLTNERLLPLLEAFPVELDEGSSVEAEEKYIDVVAWEFFRQITSTVLDPVNRNSADVTKNILSVRSDELNALKRKCVELAGNVVEKGKDFHVAKKVTNYIEQNVQQEIEDLFKLEKMAVTDTMDRIFKKESNWIAISTIIGGVTHGGPLIVAGGAIKILSALGASAFKTSRELNEKINASEYALLYRVKKDFKL